MSEYTAEEVRGYIHPMRVHGYLWVCDILEAYARHLESEQDVPVAPIERDESYDRTYIPLPGGWEIQTKGNGSTFRICEPDGSRLPIPDSPYLHETLERMARDIHAATHKEK